MDLNDNLNPNPSNAPSEEAGEFSDCGSFDKFDKNAIPRKYSDKGQNEPKKSSSFFKFLMVFLLFSSFLFNILLILAVVVMASSSLRNKGPEFNETVVIKGAKSEKIALIRIQGVIDLETARIFHEQIRKATDDGDVQGVLVAIMSPGGSVVASDEIHHDIMQFKEETGCPVLAFMQGLAASGGYYTSVACDKIIAEPTTITGSIGVIMQTFTLQELFEEKLGIDPVTFKSGEKKDWPTSFSTVTEEQKQYIQNKVIIPAYDRFVTLIDDGRENLSLDQIKELADGSIYHASEAKEKGLIDEIGYMEDAIDLIAEMANVSDPFVFEYRRHFRFSDILGSEEQSIFNISPKTIRDMKTPQLMYLWEGF